MAYVEVIRNTNDAILGLLPSYSAYYGPYTVDENKTIFITVAGEKESRGQEYTLSSKAQSREIYYSFNGNNLKLYLNEDLTEELN